MGSDDFPTQFFFWVQLIIIGISRIVCTVMPFKLYTSTTPRMEPMALCWRAYSAVMLFFFSPFHSLYHAGFSNNYLLDLLRLRERKNYHYLNNAQESERESTVFQDW